MHDIAANAIQKAGVADSQAGRQHLAAAIKAGHIKSPRELRGVIRQAKKLHERGDVNQDSGPAFKAAIDRKRKFESRQSWKATVNKQAEEWGMEPQQFAFGVMSRSKQITWENLELRDESFVREVHRWFARKVKEQGFDIDLDNPPVPMFTPFRLRAMVV